VVKEKAKDGRTVAVLTKAKAWAHGRVGHLAKDRGAEVGLRVRVGVQVPPRARSVARKAIGSAHVQKPSRYAVRPTGSVAVVKELVIGPPCARKTHGRLGKH
jgi:hypothetical protein